MKVLVLGGTRFVGKHFVEFATKKGWEVTLFHRGMTAKNLFPHLREVYGDRKTSDLDKLAKESWDVVFDTSAYVPSDIKRARKLIENTKQSYVFISSISVYEDFSKSGLTENSMLQSHEIEDLETVTKESYGRLKALCEEELLALAEEKALIIRPGYILGPDENLMRLPFFLRYLKDEKEFFAIGNEGDPLQFIDARDLVEWSIRLIESKKNGIYHCSGPEKGMTKAEFFQAIKKASNSTAEIRWVPFEKLPEEWDSTYYPMAMPPESFGAMQVDSTKAIQAGLSHRLLTETIKDTRNWCEALPTEKIFKDFYSPGKIKELLS